MIVYLSVIETAEEKSKFEQIYLHYRALMYHVAYQILHNEADAEDAVHSAFVKIAEHMKKISDPVCPKTQSYVVTIVERKAIDLYRKKKRHGSVPLDEAALAAAPPMADGGRRSGGVHPGSAAPVSAGDPAEILPGLQLRGDRVHAGDQSCRSPEAGSARQGEIAAAGGKGGDFVITDEMLAQAARQAAAQINAALPRPEECAHAFSPRFGESLKRRMPPFLFI